MGLPATSAAEHSSLAMSGAVMRSMVAMPRAENDAFTMSAVILSYSALGGCTVQPCRTSRAAGTASAIKVFFIMLLGS
jgi:hypothetical protein